MVRVLTAFLLSSLSATLSLGEAAECTDAETATAQSVWATTATTSTCSRYVTQSEPIYINAPCSATDCVAFVEAMVVDLPDCTFNGINNKHKVQNALATCNAVSFRNADSTKVGSLNTDSMTAGSSSAGSLNAGSLNADSSSAGLLYAGSVTAGSLPAGSSTPCTSSPSLQYADSTSATSMTAESLTPDPLTAESLTPGPLDAGSLDASSLTPGMKSADSMRSGPLTPGPLTAGSTSAGLLYTGSMTAGSPKADSMTAGSLTEGFPYADSTSAGSSNAAALNAGSPASAFSDTSASSGPQGPSSTSDVIAPSSAPLSSPAMASVGSAVSCSMTEAKNTRDLFVSTAKSDECTDTSTIGRSSVTISTPCDSDCARSLETMADRLPNCNYGYDSVNKKEYVLDQLDNGCTGASKFVSVVLGSDSSLKRPSSGSRAASPSSSSGSKPFDSDNGRSDEVSASSSSATGSSRTSGSAPFDGQLHLWTVIWIGIVVACAS